MYIENFQGIIENLEYNFSSKYKVKYDKDKHELSAIKKNDKKPLNFFGDNINNVTAIVGKNGAGKSSILRLLEMKYNYFKGRADNYILIYHVNDDIFYIETFHENLYKLNIKDISYYEYENEDNVNGVYIELKDNEFTLIRQPKSSLEQVVNNTVMLGSLNIMTDGYGSSEKTIARNGLNYGWEYKYRFLTYAKNKSSTYDAYRNDISICISLKNKYSFIDPVLNVNDNLFEESIGKFQRKEKIILILLYYQIKRISLELKYTSSNAIDKTLNVLIKYILNNNYKKSLEFIKNMYISLIGEIQTSGIDDQANIVYLMNLIDSLNVLPTSIFKDEYINIDISNKENEKIIDLLKSIDQMKGRAYSDISQSLDIKINHLSEGESNFMELFVSIYSSLEDYENIILVLDEPDKYFHPEWSRKFITYLKENLSIFDTNKISRKYQIILTTHSPFIVSDLPRENILIIEDCEVKDIDLRSTFGANIHMLLSNQFFMKSTIGELARQKINECIIELNKKIENPKYKIDDKKQYEIEYIIKNVGEPIIKNKLSKMYKEVFPSNEEDYMYKIKMLEEEKYKLENLLKEKKLDNIDVIMELLNKQIDILKKKSGENK